MSEILPEAFEDFEALTRLFGRTRLVLDEIMLQGRPGQAASSLLASETLPHIEGIESGFRSQLRSSAAGIEVLRELVRQGGLSVPVPRDDPEIRAALIEAMQALSGAGGPRQVVVAPGRELAALDHARIAMAMLPHMQASDVHYPGRPSYADIAPPRGAAEFVARIEEVERTIWRAATGRRASLGDPDWRRAYAFFDAGEHLSCDGLLPD